jgi:hypothetical protein
MALRRFGPYEDSVCFALLLAEGLWPLLRLYALYGTKQVLQLRGRRIQKTGKGEEAV